MTVILRTTQLVIRRGLYELCIAMVQSLMSRQLQLRVTEGMNRPLW